MCKHFEITDGIRCSALRGCHLQAVDFYDVGTCKGEVVGEEYLVLALVLGEPDNYLDFLFQGLAVDGPAEALSTIEVVVQLKEHLHVEPVHVHLSIILLGRARQSGLWSLVEIVERSIIPEAGDDLQPHFGKAVHEVPLREECISHNPLGILENLLRKTSEHMQVPVDDVESLLRLIGIAIGYSLGICMESIKYRSWDFSLAFS